MSYKWSTKPSGPWDEKYPILNPGNPGWPSPGPTVPIVYPESPGAPYIMKPGSHSWNDVSEMIIHCVHSWKGIESHWVYDLLEKSLSFDQTLFNILGNFMIIFNNLFFGGMVKDYAVEDFAVGKYKIIFTLEVVSDKARAKQVRLDDNLGLTNTLISDSSKEVTIYILDRHIGNTNEDYNDVMFEMLGTLAHEMIHAMEDIYTNCVDEESGIIYAPHGTNFQRVAQAIEKATDGPPEGDAQIDLGLELGREWAAVCDVVWDKYKEPTSTELRNMESDVEQFKKRLLRGIKQRAKEVKLDSSQLPTSSKQ